MMASKLLVVDDNPDTLTLVSWILEDHQQSFETANSGEECLEMLSKGQFGLLLLDISLPGIDGKEVARRIRAQEQLGLLPIIACTAHTQNKEVEQILAAGANCVITKPIDESKLLELIAKYLS